MASSQGQPASSGSVASTPRRSEARSGCSRAVRPQGVSCDTCDVEVVKALSEQELDRAAGVHAAENRREWELCREAGWLGNPTDLAQFEGHVHRFRCSMALALGDEVGESIIPQA